MINSLMDIPNFGCQSEEMELPEKLKYMLVHYTALKERSEVMLGWLSRAGHDLNIRDDQGATAFTWR